MTHEAGFLIHKLTAGSPTVCLQKKFVDTNVLPGLERFRIAGYYVAGGDPAGEFDIELQSVYTVFSLIHQVWKEHTKPCSSNAVGL